MPPFGLNLLLYQKRFEKNSNQQPITRRAQKNVYHFVKIASETGKC